MDPALHAHEPVIADSVSRWIEEYPGWTPADQLLVLHALVRSTASLGGDVIEIGSWCGRSAVALADALRQCGEGRLYAIDLFPELDDWFTNSDGSYSFAVDIDGALVRGCHEQTVWREPFESEIAPLYQRVGSVRAAFDGAIKAERLDRWVEAFRGTSVMFLSQCSAPPRIRLAFVDGEHSAEALEADIRVVEQLLVPGGWVAFDDFGSGYDQVDSVLARLLTADRGYDTWYRPTRKMLVVRRAAQAG